MAYSVKTAVYEGPLDLLLDLISKQRVDVADISVSGITDEYLQIVRGMEELDLDLASSFLVLAATLLELKSFKLLPGRIVDDRDIALLLEERDHLLHRLVEYSTFKNASARLEAMIEDNRGFYFRQAGPPPELLEPGPGDLAGLTQKRFLGAAQKALGVESVENVDISHVTPIRISVREMVDLLSEQLQREGESTFRILCGGKAGRLDVIVRFLALLELFKSRSVELDQAEPFEEINVKWLNETQEAG